MDWGNTTVRQDEKHLGFGIGEPYIRGLTVCKPGKPARMNQKWKTSVMFRPNSKLFTMTWLCHNVPALTKALSYYSDLMRSQPFQPMAAKLSKKAVLPLAKILVTASCHNSNTGPRIDLMHKHVSQYGPYAIQSKSMSC